MANRLAGETSPYLLQHAHNPVDWYPWGPEALARARAEDKPILLSIGYSACHWCHVMERESFENEYIARLMNEHFVSIKVDREERPDLDAVYMDAVQAMTGHGGWPMTVFLTPDGVPFFGGTYDQVGGGFHRYSVDEVWLVPHFEKMLYDNALLSRVYLAAYQLTSNPFYRRIAEQTLDYVAREMTSPEGGFYSSQDADSEGVEGKFYVWSPEEVLEALGEEDGRLFNLLYDVTRRGNFEGHNILHLPP